MITTIFAIFLSLIFGISSLLLISYIVGKYNK